MRSASLLWLSKTRFYLSILVTFNCAPAVVAPSCWLLIILYRSLLSNLSFSRSFYIVKFDISVSSFCIEILYKLSLSEEIFFIYLINSSLSYFIFVKSSLTLFNLLWREALSSIIASILSTYSFSRTYGPPIDSFTGNIGRGSAVNVTSVGGCM